MRKFVCFVILSIVVFGASSAMAGNFFSTLDNAHCKSLSPWETRVGCNGYLQYRIQFGYDKNKAKDKCPWGCSVVFKNQPAKIQGCKQGCAKANALDRR